MTQYQRAGILVVILSASSAYEMDNFILALLFIITMIVGVYMVMGDK